MLPFYTFSNLSNFIFRLRIRSNFFFLVCSCYCSQWEMKRGKLNKQPGNAFSLLFSLGDFDGDFFLCLPRVASSENMTVKNGMSNI